MKTYCLWLLVILVLFHAGIALETYPEIHVLAPDDYTKQLEETKKLGPDAQFVRHIEEFEYFNGRYGVHLVSSTIIIDAIMLTLLVVAIRSSRKEKPASDPPTR